MMMASKDRVGDGAGAISALSCAKKLSFVNFAKTTFDFFTNLSPPSFPAGIRLIPDGIVELVVTNVEIALPNSLAISFVLGGLDAIALFATLISLWS